MATPCVQCHMHCLAVHVPTSSDTASSFLSQCYPPPGARMNAITAIIYNILRTMRQFRMDCRKREWRMQESNQRPYECKSYALPTELIPLYDSRKKTHYNIHNILDNLLSGRQNIRPSLFFTRSSQPVGRSGDDPS
jgi:hypothetical protein